MVNNKNKELLKKDLSDEDYWKKYTPSKENEFDDEDHSFHNHDISFDVTISFKNFNGVIFHSKEKNINCNISELNCFFDRLKKQIRLLDETKSDSIGDGNGGF